MTGWGQHIDDLAAAVADLLTDTSVRISPLTDASGTFACRDAVVVQLRQLVGSLADTPPVAQVRLLQLFDVTHRPAQALHQALAELPRAGRFGAADLNTYLEKGLPPFEQRWRDAARAALGLESYVDVLGRVPDHHSWDVLRDLADLAAALPALDHDLSEAILPWLKSGEGDLAVPYTMLTHPAHDSVRVCTTEIRSRVPAVPPSTRSAPLRPAVLGGGELDKAMGRYVRTVLDRSGQFSIGDLRAVSRLLQFGATFAAVALERAQQAVPGAEVAAAGLSQVAPLAEQLRDSPARTLGPERLDVLRDSSELLARMNALATQERALPGGASDTALRRLAAPALEFAKHVPNLARALEVGVRESLAGGLMLVPSAADKTNKSSLLWVPSRESGGGRDSTPVVQQHASALARAAEGVSPGVRTAQAALDQHQVRIVDPVREAAAQARSHAGMARAQLREVLAQQAGTVPPPLSSPLPAHPRLAPNGPTVGRGR